MNRFVYLYVLQPDLTDEEGWKRFCLGERVCVGDSTCDTEVEAEPGVDYNKVVQRPFSCWK